MDRKKLSLLLVAILIGIVIVLVLVSKKIHFVPIEDERQVQGIIQRLPWIEEITISDFQKQKLQETIAEVLVIYKDRNFEKFIDYLQRRKGRLNPLRIAVLKDLPIFKIREISPSQLPPNLQQEYQRVRQIVEKVAPQFANWPPKDDLNLFKAFWLLSYHEAGPWNGVDIKTTYIRVFRTDQPINPNVALAAIRSPNRLVMSRDTLFPGEEERPCLYAEAYFVARHPTPDPPWGYYLWFRWSNQAQNWFLDLAGMTFSGKRGENTNLIF